MQVGDPEWWVLVITAAIALVAVLTSWRSAVSKRQRDLRGQLREVLREVSDACDDYAIADWRPRSSQRLAEAAKRLKIIEDEGILSPNRRQIRELQLWVWDLSTRDEATRTLPASLQYVMSPDELEASMQGHRAGTEAVVRYVSRLSAKYRHVTGKMDNGWLPTYWHYRLIPPFIIRENPQDPNGYRRRRRPGEAASEE
jgi:hypothetical protein